MKSIRKKRKTSADLNVEYEFFLEMVAEKKPELEIMLALGLSKVQLKNHLIRAFQDGKITADALIPEYELIHAKSLPAAILSLKESLSRNSYLRLKATTPSS